MSQSSYFEEPIEIVRHRITKIEIFEITSDELDALESAFAQENRSLAFFTSTLSIFVTCAIGWLTTGHTLTPTAQQVVAGVTFACFFLTLWFGFNWRQATKQRPKIIQRIKERRRLT